MHVKTEHEKQLSAGLALAPKPVTQRDAYDVAAVFVDRGQMPMNGWQRAEVINFIAARLWFEWGHGALREWQEAVD